MRHAVRASHPLAEISFRFSKPQDQFELRTNHKRNRPQIEHIAIFIVATPPLFPSLCPSSSSQSSSLHPFIIALAASYFLPNNTHNALKPSFPSACSLDCYPVDSLASCCLAVCPYRPSASPCHYHQVQAPTPRSACSLPSHRAGPLTNRRWFGCLALSFWMEGPFSLAACLLHLADLRKVSLTQEGLGGVPVGGRGESGIGSSCCISKITPRILTCSPVGTTFLGWGSDMFFASLVLLVDLGSWS